MCAAGLYVVRGIGQVDRFGHVLVGPTCSKKLAQDFLDSWAEKKLWKYTEDFDVDIYDQKLGMDDMHCSGCLFWNNGCERIDKSG